MQKTMIAGCAALMLLTGCAEQALKLDLQEGNYCETKDDCVLIGSKCPFDCYVYANKDKAEELKERMYAFESDCEYSCIATAGVECRQNVCVAVPETQAEGGGNTGASCTSDDECDTPMSYLIRSICPYDSRCVDGTCAVTCPMMDHDPVPSQAVACTADADCDCSSYGALGTQECRCNNGQCVAVVEK